MKVTDSHKHVMHYNQNNSFCKTIHSVLFVYFCRCLSSS